MHSNHRRSSTAVASTATAVSGAMGSAGGGVYLETSSLTQLQLLPLCRTTKRLAMAVACAANAADPDFDHCTFYMQYCRRAGRRLLLLQPVHVADASIIARFMRNSAMNGSAVAAVYSAQITMQLQHYLCMGEAGVAAYCQDYGGVTISCCDAWGNVDGNGCIQSQLGSSNNFEEYPGFCDPLDPELRVDDSGIRRLVRRRTVRAASRSVPGAWIALDPLTHTVCAQQGDWRLLVHPAGTQCSSIRRHGRCCVTRRTRATATAISTTAARILIVQSEGGNPENCVINCGGSASASHRGFYFHSGETAAAQLGRRAHHEWLQHRCGRAAVRNSVHRRCRADDLQLRSSITTTRITKAAVCARGQCNAGRQRLPVRVQFFRRDRRRDDRLWRGHVVDLRLLVFRQYRRRRWRRIGDVLAHVVRSRVARSGRTIPTCMAAA